METSSSNVAATAEALRGDSPLAIRRTGPLEGTLVGADVCCAGGPSITMWPFAPPIPELARETR